MLTAIEAEEALCRFEAEEVVGGSPTIFYKYCDGPLSFFSGKHFTKDENFGKGKYDNRKFRKAKG